MSTKKKQVHHSNRRRISGELKHMNFELDTREKREKALMEAVGKVPGTSEVPGTSSQSESHQLTFMNLDDLSLAHKAAGYTILYSADVDQLSEKQQQHALKYYPDYSRPV